MGEHEFENLMSRASDAREAFIDATDRNDWQAALDLGVDELLPVTEAVAAADRDYLDGVAVVLGDLAGLCYHLDRDIAELYFRHRAFHTMMILEAEDRPMFEGVRTAPVAAAERAHRLMIAPHPDYRELPDSERSLFVPAARTLPVSIDMFAARGAWQGAAYAQSAASWLREVEGTWHPDLVQAETEAMVKMAQIGWNLTHHSAVWTELRMALTVWLDQLGHGVAHWSNRQRKTLTDAAEVLDLMGAPAGAKALRAAIAQVTAAEAGDSPDRLLQALDLTDHYRTALATMPPDTDTE